MRREVISRVVLVATKKPGVSLRSFQLADLAVFYSRDLFLPCLAGTRLSAMWETILASTQPETWVHSWPCISDGLWCTCNSGLGRCLWYRTETSPFKVSCWQKGITDTVILLFLFENQLTNKLSNQHLPVLLEVRTPCFLLSLSSLGERCWWEWEILGKGYFI